MHTAVACEARKRKRRLKQAQMPQRYPCSVRRHRCFKSGGIKRISASPEQNGSTLESGNSTSRRQVRNLSPVPKSILYPCVVLFCTTPSGEASRSLDIPVQSPYVTRGLSKSHSPPFPPTQGGRGWIPSKKHLAPIDLLLRTVVSADTPRVLSKLVACCYARTERYQTYFTT